MKTTLLIVRHGNTFTPNDIVTRVGKRTDLPSVQSGIEQGLKLGAYLKTNNLIPDVVYVSHLTRTKQTASYALTNIGITREIIEDTLFDEIDYGIDENKPEEEVIARLGKEALEAWDKDAIVPDGWKVNPQEIIDGWKEFGKRIQNQHKGKTVLVVTSNGIARFAPYLTGDFEAFSKQHKIKLSTGALCCLTNDDSSENWIVEGWNIKP